MRGEGSEAATTELSTRAAWMTLVAMTLANSLILIDQTAVPLATPEAIDDLGGGVNEGQWLLTANILPLAAFMVFGGRLGDLLGLRRIFVIGTAIFMVSTTMAGIAQDMPWMLAARVCQGLGAALMMPTAVAITSATWPLERRGMALGVLAGGSAFFAALGPVLGGLLTSIDWRLVFLVNVPLAGLTIFLALSATPALRPLSPGRVRDLDFLGMTTLALAAGGIVFSLSQLQGEGLTSPSVLVALAVGVLSLIAFTVVELRSSNPLLDLRLFRHKNFLASNISQMLAGAIELGLGFLLPFLLLLVIGVSPAVAGIALIPSTIPIILAGPLAGRVFDRIGGRVPLVAGFLLLAASGVALALAVSDRTVLALIPGLVLQGFGLGIVLTVNDPTGLNSVSEADQGRAAGMINTSEQLGGALGIAILLAVEIGWYRHELTERFASQGVQPTEKQIDTVKEFILQAEQEGIKQADSSKIPKGALDDVVLTHIDGFQLMFYVSAGIALLGALACFFLVRKEDRVSTGPVFSRRSRWSYVTSGRTPGITRHRTPSDEEVGSDHGLPNPPRSPNDSKWRGADW